MTRLAFLKKYILRFSATLALLGLIVYVLFHVLVTNEPPMTTPAYLHTDYQLAPGQAYLFRDEQVLRTANAGVINRLAQNGEKIGRGVAVCEVWSGYGEATREAAQVELDSILRMISILEDSRVSAGTTFKKAELFRQEANAIYVRLRTLLASGESAELRELSDRMLTLLNRYRTVVSADERADMNEMLEALCDARDALLRGAPYTVYNSNTSGYFYDASQVDGYEEIFTKAALDALTVESLEALSSAEPIESAGFAVGKMASGSRWYLAVDIDAAYAPHFEAGGAYDVRFPDNGGRELRMICDRVLAEDGGAVTILYTDEMPTDFVYLRSQRVEITVGSFVGYHVPDAAMRVQNGVEGVFIFEESTVRFRRVEVLYRGDGYCIVAEQGDRGKEYLAQNDMMITSGDNL